MREILGYGSSLDGFRVSDPDPSGQGAVQSMRRAMKSAGLQPDDIDCVNAHGTGTPKNDVTETAAIKEVLGTRAYEIPVHAVKSMTGHMIAASGAAEAAAAALTLSRRHGSADDQSRQARPDVRPGLCSPTVPGRLTGDTVLSNSFGFGGQNATLILREVAMMDADAFLRVLRSRRSIRQFSDSQARPGVDRAADRGGLLGPVEPQPPGLEIHCVRG